MSSTISSDQLIISNRLISAVNAGNLETARDLINSFGLSYSKAWSDGYALLLHATMMNRTAMVELLLKSGSPVNSNYHYKPADTPLHFSAFHGNVDIVKMLLNKDADINARNEDGKTPLFNVIDMVDIAYEHKDKLEVIELLLKHKADINASDNAGTSPLHIAVKSRCLKIVELLLEYGVNVNCVMYAAKWNKNYTAIHFAVEYDLKEVTMLLLSRGASVDVKSENGITPLHICAKKGYTHIGEELLNHGACINSATFVEGCTPLHFACEGYIGSLPISERSNFEETNVKFFLVNGADINARTKDNLTPLHISTKRQNTAIVKLLLQHGAKVDDEGKDGKTILHLAVENGNLMIVEEVLKYCPDVNNQSNRSSLKTAVYGCRKEKIIQALVEYGLHMNPDDTNNPDLLHVAVQKGYLQIVKDLLKNGADVKTLIQNSTCGKGFTPLHRAIKNNQDEIAKLLVSYEADVNAQDESGKTPIFYAIQNADLKMTRLLLTNKANVKDNPELLFLALKKDCIEIVEALLQYDTDINFINAQDKCGKTPIFYAIENADIKMTKLLLTYKANVKDNPELLHIAVKKKYIEIVRLLLNNGADVNAKQKNGMTALHIAVEENNTETLEILLDSGADVNTRDYHGRTVLHIASFKGYQGVIKRLLKCGCDIDAQDDNGRTALYVACEAADEYIVKTLLKYGSDINLLSKDNQTPFDIAVQKSDLCFDSDSDDDDYYVASPFDCIREILFNHIVKMKTANLYVNRKNLFWIHSDTIRTYFEDECEEEIEKMKSEKIINANISFYDILAKDTITLAKYMRNENVVQFLKSFEFKSEFPIYASMIKSYFKKVMKRIELLDQVNDIIYFLFKNLLELPYHCTDKILSYLSDEDLRIIMDAYNKPLSISNPNP